MKSAILSACALAVLSSLAAAQTTPPTWLKRPSEPELAKVWPTEALRRNIGGRAELDCQVNLQGLLEDCRIVSERPPGMGFGAAALALAPKYVMRPAMVDGKPVVGRMRLPIGFRMEGEGDLETGSNIPNRIDPAAPSILVVSHPIWLRAPTNAQLSAAYPKSAKPGTGFGHVVLACKVQPTGELKGCKTDSEQPTGQGFAAAAKTLTPAFQLAVLGMSAKDVSQMQINLPIHFTAQTGGERVIEKPDWLAPVAAEAGEDPFPARAAAAGLVTGRAVLDCVADNMGRLHACTVASEEPGNMDFGAAALRVASRMVVNPWTSGGQPVDGAHVHFGARINKSGSEAR